MRLCACLVYVLAIFGTAPGTSLAVPPPNDNFDQEQEFPSIALERRSPCGSVLDGAAASGSAPPNR